MLVIELRRDANATQKMAAEAYGMVHTIMPLRKRKRGNNQLINNVEIFDSQAVIRLYITPHRHLVK
jgi:hypothetical protein